MKKTLTIFTPTYNRAYCLENGYKALCRQTLKDFVWIVVDDGSTDNTRALVQSWIDECTDFEIKYIYKENGGMYTGYNKAIELADTELCVCVDSDDYLTDNAVEIIVEKWKKEGSDEYAGIVGLDCLENGTVIGDLFPEQKSINLIDLLFDKYPLKNGDRKNVVRTELYKKHCPMEEFPGEKDFNPHFLHLKISLDYDFLILNEKLCVVEYQPEGMSNTIFKQYLRSPKSFRKMRLLDMTLPGIPFKYLIKTLIHYTSSCIISKEPCVSASPRKFLTVLMWPLGLMLTFYIKIYNKK
ncbi:MAG: glycosyltransferase family 2 protein [Ruminococcaceae bacterium]|nr:glycosyltransferase family 2 protein [Oscillospiraceae bacterium]